MQTLIDNMYSDVVKRRLAGEKLTSIAKSYPGASVNSLSKVLRHSGMMQEAYLWDELRERNSRLEAQRELELRVSKILNEDPEEEWAIIPSHPNYYASTKARILSTLTGVVRKPNLVGQNHSLVGYLQLRLREEDGTFKFKYLHRLVMEAHVGPCPEGQEVNHREGNPWLVEYNHLEHLEYTTHTENVAHAVEYLGFEPGVGLPKARQEARVARLVMSIEAPRKEVFRLLKGGMSREDVADKFGIGIAVINKMVKSFGPLSQKALEVTDA